MKEEFLSSIMSTIVPGTPAYIPDLICFDQVIVDTKTVEQISDREVGQMLNYLKVTGHEVGLLINFKHAQIEWKRVVLQTKRGKAE